MTTLDTQQYATRLGAHQLPRLTRYLRSFTSLEPRKDVIDNASVKPLERHKKFTWTDLKKIIENQLCMTPTVSKNLSQLQDLSKTITGGDQIIIDETSLFIFRLFMDKKKTLNRHCTVIKQLYGNVNFNTVSQICNVVNQVVDELSEDCILKIKKGYENKNDDDNHGGKFLWGGHIIFNPPSQWIPPDTSFLSDLNQQRNVVDSFSMVYSEPAKMEDSSAKVVYDKAWLIREVEKCFPNGNPMGVSSSEFSDSIMELLNCSKSTDELQNELFDFLGYDSFELTSALLEHRKDISLTNKLEKEKTLLRPLANERKCEGYINQVTVKSLDEKIMEKQARKEEKKLAKYAIREEPEEDKSKIDILDLRSKRIAALSAPNSRTIQEKKKPAEPKEVFPHVYDAGKSVQSQTGFIGGVKMMLPDDVKRTDNKQYEEVDIPPQSPGQLTVGNEKVPVSSLDEFGQLAFSGVSHLNRIQSVVFNTAYNTNENLLICAPTGAGKTNIALLTVVYTIRQNIVNGVIKKDQFKIVYVAPMKALAAEMAANFNKKLSCLGITVKELTGDIQLTKQEILQTQMIVTTPEKWDVVTRKGTGDVALTRLVKLLIIDEVHLLHGDRGPVVEALVARTLRQVESSQTMIRIVGLSATLPNYIDVARFLRVNPSVGLFYFDSRFRPVPLRQTFIGVKATKTLQQMNEMDQVCYEKVVDLVRKGHQVMVFVHARNATSRIANIMIEMARSKNDIGVFAPERSPATTVALNAFQKARSRQLGELFSNGFAIHHAGLLRGDRSLVEKYFGQGLIKVLCCTSTLAWGVNLPAHAVVIRGTEIYDAKHGSFIDLGILDVLQIFGRAGRPQFDSSGHGIIITSHNKLSHYLSLLTNQIPIESNFINFLADNLNAEISLGTISNVNEAVEWLSYSYLFVRMKINPQVYGLNYQDILDDPRLEEKRRELISCAAKALDKARMIRYNIRTGDLAITDLGRIASNFYIKYDTVEIFNEMMTSAMSEADIFNMVSHSQEFQQLKVRDDEMDELENLCSSCEFEVAGGKENLHGKVNILMQSFLGRHKVDSFSLMSDLSYITQNAVRIMRALFEINLRGNNALLAGRLHQMALMLEHQQWTWETPLRQFHMLPYDIIDKIEKRDLSVQAIREMDSKEIGILLRNSRLGPVVKKCAWEFPLLDLEASLHPITRTILRVKLQITPNFSWNVKVHSKSSEAYWVWIEDPEDTNIYHSEYFLLSRKQVIAKETQELVMTMPLVEPIPSQYIINVTSDYWIGCSNVLPISVKNLILPESHPPHTELLDLQPLPVKALENKDYEDLFKFSHFNPIQTQIFHCLYHSDSNVLLGAPTGSGKTIIAEIAMFRVFNKYPGCKVVYVAPLKALVRERMDDWKIRIEGKLGRTVVELTGDVTPDVQAISKADVIVTTPEKWDGVSRSWQTRGYVKEVALIVLDEVHLLGEERGPVLEVIVSRTNFISAHTTRPLRIVALSTALANARDLANWLAIKEMGLYNFRPSVRPVPLEVHIHGFPGKHYCPRMATMNRPVYQAISTHSPSQPALVFVSSRRQTRLTALDLIAFLAGEDNPKMWMHTNEQEMDQIISTIKDTNLRLTLAFGIGLHHAGLQERDRKTVEELFVNQKIQVLIATGTLAWGVNLPAHLVVVKGTEYYDGKTKRYVDMPITDVLQMMGRAGRPQYDNQGIAVILVHDVKKNFYRRFLYEPFPVESNLLQVLPDHLSAEIVAGTIKTKQEALDYLTWTYFFRRLLKNPAYYGLESLEPQDVNGYLSNLVDKTLLTLFHAGCVNLDEDNRTISTTSMARIAAFYYLAYQTMTQLTNDLGPSLNIEKCCYIMCHVYEYSQLPVRHNEEHLNGDLAKQCPWPVSQLQLDSPHIKTFLLLQAHFSRLDLPCTDYYTDLKSVMDQAMRILQGMIDVSGECGWLSTTLCLQNLMQMLIQGRWLTDSPLSILPHVDPHMAKVLQAKRGGNLASVVHAATKGYSSIAPIFSPQFDDGQIDQIYRVLKSMPILKVNWRVEGSNVSQTSEKFVRLLTGEEYVLNVSLERLNPHQDRRAYAPKYSKIKYEGWFLTLGSIENGELLAMRRVTFQQRRTRVQLLFSAPSRPGNVILTLYVFSDTFLGLDQQYDIPLTVETSMQLDSVRCADETKDWE